MQKVSLVFSTVVWYGLPVLLRGLRFSKTVCNKICARKRIHVLDRQQMIFNIINIS